MADRLLLSDGSLLLLSDGTSALLLSGPTTDEYVSWGARGAFGPPPPPSPRRLRPDDEDILVALL